MYYFLLVTEGSGCDVNLGLEEETIQARSVLTNIETEMIFFQMSFTLQDSQISSSLSSSNPESGRLNSPSAWCFKWSQLNSSRHRQVL